MSGAVTVLHAHHDASLVYEGQSDPVIPKLPVLGVWASVQMWGETSHGVTIIGPWKFIHTYRPLQLVPTTDYPLGQSLRGVRNENWELNSPYKTLSHYAPHSLLLQSPPYSQASQFFIFVSLGLLGALDTVDHSLFLKTLFLLAFESPYSSCFPLTLLAAPSQPPLLASPLLFDSTCVRNSQ